MLGFFESLIRKQILKPVKTSRFPAGSLALLFLAGTACTNLPEKSSQTGSNPISVEAPPVVTGGGGENSRSMLDWGGKYAGTLPCADCEGIETTVLLKYNGSYVSTQRYLGKSGEIRRQEGPFEWSADGGSVTLNSGGGSGPAGSYLVGEERLFALDQKGQRITGAGADKYILDKVSIAVTGRRWELLELAGKAVSPPAAGGQRSYFVLEEGSTRVTGSGACNNFTATYKMSDRISIRFQNLASTRRACAPGNPENEFFEALKAASMYTFSGEDTLFLHPPEGSKMAKFAAAN